MRNTRDRSGIGSCHSCGSLPGELDLPQIAPSVDWINVMTYDFRGAWESAGPTNHSSALFGSSCETTGGDWADTAIQAYVAGVGDRAKVQSPGGQELNALLGRRDRHTLDFRRQHVLEFR